MSNENLEGMKMVTHAIYKDAIEELIVTRRLLSKLEKELAEMKAYVESVLDKHDVSRKGIPGAFDPTFKSTKLPDPIL